MPIGSIILYYTYGTNVNTNRFRQPVPIPSYLLSIAVGDLVSKEVGPRSAVWCEKEILDASAFEFSEVSLLGIRLQHIAIEGFLPSMSPGCENADF